MGQIFTKACYVTAFVNSLLSMVPSYASWRRKALGPGGRRPDGIVAAFFTNAAWLAFGMIEKSDEAVGLNAICGLFQLVNLATYTALCTWAERLGLLKRVVCASLFLFLTVRMGLAHDAVNLFKLMCTMYGLAAAVTPNIITVYMTEPRTLDRLPHWAISVFSVLNGVAWFARGLNIWNIPMAVQNGAGAVCSLWFLRLLFAWDKPENRYPPLLVPGGTSTNEQVPANETSPAPPALVPAPAAAEAKIVRGPKIFNTVKSSSSEKVDRSLIQDLHKPSDDASTSGNSTAPSETSPAPAASASALATNTDAAKIIKEAGGNGAAPKETSLVPASSTQGAKIIKDAGGNGAAPKETSLVPASSTQEAKIVKDAGGNGAAPKETSLVPASSTQEAKIVKDAGGNGAAPKETSLVPASSTSTQGAKIIKDAGGNGAAPSESSTVPPAAASAPAADTEGGENVEKPGIIDEPNME